MDRLRIQNKISTKDSILLLPSRICIREGKIRHGLCDYKPQNDSDWFVHAAALLGQIEYVPEDEGIELVQKIPWSARGHGCRTSVLFCYTWLTK